MLISQNLAFLVPSIVHQLVSGRCRHTAATRHALAPLGPEATAAADLIMDDVLQVRLALRHGLAATLDASRTSNWYEMYLVDVDAKRVGLEALRVPPSKEEVLSRYVLEFRPSFSIQI